MKMWKRLAASILAVGLLGTALAGCAAPKEEKKDPAPAAGGEAKQEQKVKNFEIVFWEQEEAAEKFFDPILAKFMEKHPNIKVTRVHYETEKLRSNFLTAVQGGQAPQVVYGPDDNVGVFATAGVIQPLDSFFSNGFLDTINPIALDGNRFNGKLWGMPDRIGNQLMLIYNKKLVATPPKNTDELIKFAGEFKKTNPDGYALVFNQVEPFWAAPWLGGYGGKVFNDKNEPTLDTPAMVNTFKLMVEFKNKNVMPKEADYDAAEALFKEGKAAMIINGPWSVNGYLEKGLDIGITRIPQISGADWPKPYTSTKSYFVSKLVTDPEEKKAVATFIEFMNSAAIQTELAKLHKQQPSNKQAAESDVVKNDVILNQAKYQLETGTPMPIIPQMRAVWDSWKPQWQLALAGQAKPEDAAKQAQKDALKIIAEMK
ncbi:MAG: extracellular solute-binding protein [Bacillota bacterium]